MDKIKQYIEDYTNHCSNETIHNEFQPWLTPYHALAIADITKEETLKEVSKWLWDNIYNYINDPTLESNLKDENYRSWLVDAFNREFKIEN